MMSDIVVELRQWAEENDESHHARHMVRRAADEIERLRAFVGAVTAEVDAGYRELRHSLGRAIAEDRNTLG